MNNVYLDILFLINFFADYITLLCTAKLSHAAIHRWAILLTSIIGAFYACLCMIYQSHWINTLPVNIACGMLLSYISFHKEEHIFRCCISFLIISAVFGGILTPFVFVTQQGMHLSINIKTLIVTFSVVYFVLSCLYRHVFSNKTQCFQQVEISFRNKVIKLTVLMDTGNELYDPISNLPVLIVERKPISLLIPEIDTIHSKGDVFEAFCQLNIIPDLAGKIRFIPYQSVCEKNILLGFMPDSVVINGKAREMIVAYTDLKLSTNNQYQGLY